MSPSVSNMPRGSIAIPVPVTTLFFLYYSMPLSISNVPWSIAIPMPVTSLWFLYYSMPLSMSNVPRGSITIPVPVTTLYFLYYSMPSSVSNMPWSITIPVRVTTLYAFSITACHPQCLTCHGGSIAIPVPIMTLCFLLVYYSMPLSVSNMPRGVHRHTNACQYVMLSLLQHATLSV